MFWLFLGILIWTVAHLFPSVMADKRNALNAQHGNKYQGAFALVIVASLALIVVGWRSSAIEVLYNAPTWGRHINMLFMLIALIVFSAAHGNSRIKQYIRHPMLVAVLIWGVGHLLANGETRSVLLFGGMVIWSILSIIFINRRDGAWEKPAAVPAITSEIKLVAIGLVVYVVLMFLHPYFTGMPVITRS